jgi:hypothetical protein
MAVYQVEYLNGASSGDFIITVTATTWALDSNLWFDFFEDEDNIVMTIKADKVLSIRTMPWIED